MLRKAKSNVPVLEAVMFEMADYAVIQAWHKQNVELFEVIMPAGVALADFSNVVFSPEVWNSCADGILIANHIKLRSADVDTAVRILHQRRMQLYAVTNGVLPIVREPTAQGTVCGILDFQTTHSGILRVLSECKSALRWLEQSAPIERVPQVHEDRIKCLERLGFVFRRDKRTVGLRKQRLKKVLERESKKLGFSFGIEDLIR